MKEIYLKLLNSLVKYGISDNLVLRVKKNKIIEIEYKDHYVSSFDEVILLITILKQFDINTEVSYLHIRRGK